MEIQTTCQAIDILILSIIFVFMPLAVFLFIYICEDGGLSLGAPKKRLD